MTKTNSPSANSESCAVVPAEGTTVSFLSVGKGSGIVLLPGDSGRKLPPTKYIKHGPNGAICFGIFY